MWLLECPKALASEHASGVKEFTWAKNCWHLLGSTFIIIFSESWTNWVRKDLCLSDMNSLDSFVRLCLPITCIFVIIEGNFLNTLKPHYLKKEKYFFWIFIAFLQSRQNFAFFERKGELYSLNGWEVIDSKKCGCLNAQKLLFFRTPFGSQRFHKSQTQLDSAGHHLFSNFAAIQHVVTQETSLLVRSKIVGEFVDVLAPDHMYSRRNWWKFPQHVKTPLSQKGKIFF